MNNKPICVIGYSGHAYVVIDIFNSIGKKVSAYCDGSVKTNNPFHLEYLGSESSLSNEVIQQYDFFASIGNNSIREKVFNTLQNSQASFINAIHASAVVSPSANIGLGVMVSAGAIINALAQIGNSVICNTSCVIEHECLIGDFVHIAPGAVLCGNVTVGTSTFIGANAVIKQGISIGNNCIIGAGAVVVKDVVDGSSVLGNPAK